VPTRDEVVTRMLSIAGVTSEDLVYDLGSGDGRIVIAAATRHGARGVGVDINPERIAEAQRNARKAGVTGMVRFVEQDLFDADIHEATVVTLYLLPEVNLKLRPKLLRELRPGTRVISHDFDMGDWQPDEVAEIGKSTVYAWIVPAGVAGTWDVRIEGSDRASADVISLSQRFQRVGGAARVGGRNAQLADVMLRGADLRFALETAPGAGVLRFQGRVDGDTIQGTVAPKGRPDQARAFTASRRPAR
jgi:SAM-dependent methyltransferase